eukprot:9467020-Pyramimonas_sp.AAC.1
MSTAAWSQMVWTRRQMFVPIPRATSVRCIGIRWEMTRLMRLPRLAGAGVTCQVPCVTSTASSQPCAADGSLTWQCLMSHLRRMQRRWEERAAELVPKARDVLPPAPTFTHLIRRRGKKCTCDRCPAFPGT